MRYAMYNGARQGIMQGLRSRVGETLIAKGCETQRTWTRQPRMHAMQTRRRR